MVNRFEEIDFNKLQNQDAFKQPLTEKKSALETVRELVNKDFSPTTPKINPLSQDQATVNNKKITNTINKIKNIKNPKTIKRDMALTSVRNDSAKLYFESDNPITFKFLNQRLEEKIKKLNQDYGIVMEDLLESKLEGKNIAKTKLFETLAIMLALSSILKGSKKQKVTNTKYELRINEYRQKLNMLEVEINENDLKKTALEKGLDFLSLLKDKAKLLDNRIFLLNQYLGIDKELL